MDNKFNEMNHVVFAGIIKAFTIISKELKQVRRRRRNINNHWQHTEQFSHGKIFPSDYHHVEPSCRVYICNGWMYFNNEFSTKKKLCTFFLLLLENCLHVERPMLPILLHIYIYCWTKTLLCVAR